MIKGSSVYMGGRDTGKTTILVNRIKELAKNGYRILVLDSATDHEDKSLLRKIMKEMNGAKEYSMNEESKIVIDKIGIDDFVKSYKDYWPFNEIIKSREAISCIDLSYFLEKGYEFLDANNDQKTYKHYRTLYNNQAQQLLVSLLCASKEYDLGKIAVVSDEIEFPLVDYDLNLDKADILLVSAIHPENSFGSFYSELKDKTIVLTKKFR